MGRVSALPATHLEVAALLARLMKRFEQQMLSTSATSRERNSESTEKSKPGSLSRRPKAYFGEGGSGRRALHSPAGRDVIPSQTRRATGGAHRERWRDRPCEAAATGEAYRQASWQVPTPAEETPRDEGKDLSDEASLHRASAKQERRGATLEPESQRTIRRPDPFTNLAEPRLAYERVFTLGVPVLAYKTFVEDGETLAEGLPERATRKICLDNYPHDGIDICNGRCKYHGE
jgi:hypothetical protein